MAHYINNSGVVAIPKDIHQLYNVNRERHRENLQYVIKQIYGDK